jgi:hypothetical protein
MFPLLLISRGSRSDRGAKREKTAPQAVDSLSFIICEKQIKVVMWRAYAVK